MWKEQGMFFKINEPTYHKCNKINKIYDQKQNKTACSCFESHVWNKYICYWWIQLRDAVSEEWNSNRSKFGHCWRCWNGMPSTYKWAYYRNSIPCRYSNINWNCLDCIKNIWHHTFSVEHDDSVWQFSRLSNDLLPRRRITRFIMVLNHNEFRGGHLLFSFWVSLQASFSQSKNSNCRSTNVIFIFLVAHIYDNNRRWPIIKTKKVWCTSWSLHRNENYNSNQTPFFENELC